MNPLAIRWLSFRVLRYGWPQWIFISLISVAMAAGASLTALAASKEHQQYQQALADGANVLIVHGDGEVVDSATCDRLVRRTDVLASGAISHGKVLHAQSAPGVGIQGAKITDGFLNVIVPGFPLNDEPGIFLASEAAVDLGASHGSLLELQEIGTVRLAGVVDPSLRSPDKARWMFVAEHSGFRAEECWLETSEGKRGAVASSLGSAFPTSVGLRVSYLHESVPEESIDASLTNFRRYLPWIASGLSVSFVLLSNRFELGTRTLLRVSGMSGREMLVYGLWRGFLVASAGLVLTMLTLLSVFLVKGGSAIGITHAVATVTLVYATVILSTAIGSLPSRGNAIVHLRD